MKSKKLLAILLVLSLAMCIFPASAFAEEVSSATAVDSVDYATAYSITLWNHTDVVVRDAPSLSGHKIHTLYIGDTVQIQKWNYASADGYDWAHLIHYDSGTQEYIEGFSVNKFLS